MGTEKDNGVNKLLLAILMAMLGLGGVSGISAFRGPTTAEIMEKVEETRSCSRDLLEMHKRYDADGIPIWYVPRSMIDTLSSMEVLMREEHTLNVKILDVLNDISNGGHGG